MEDQEIYALYFKRNEQAIAATHQKYGSWCRGIAHRILNNKEETDECVSDTYLTVWNNIPPQRPQIFRAWLGKITRNLALTRYRHMSAAKRGGGETPLVLSELSYCVSGNPGADQNLEAKEVTRIINQFLDSLNETQRNIFMRRYWHMAPIAEIAKVYHMSESKVTSMLFRQRKQLKVLLEKEGVAI